MKRLHGLALIPLSAALAACELSSAYGAASSAPPLVLNLASRPPGSCSVHFAGHSFALPEQAAALQEALIQQRLRTSGAAVAGDETIPYKCFGHALYVAQRAGFERVGFVAEPPRP